MRHEALGAAQESVVAAVEDDDERELQSPVDAIAAGHDEALVHEDTAPHAQSGDAKVTTSWGLGQLRDFASMDWGIGRNMRGAAGQITSFGSKALRLAARVLLGMDTAGKITALSLECDKKYLLHSIVLTEVYMLGLEKAHSICREITYNDEIINDPVVHFPKTAGWVSHSWLCRGISEEEKQKLRLKYLNSFIERNNEMYKELSLLSKSLSAFGVEIKKVLSREPRPRSLLVGDGEALHHDNTLHGDSVALVAQAGAVGSGELHGASREFLAENVSPEDADAVVRILAEEHVARDEGVRAMARAINQGVEVTVADAAGTGVAVTLHVPGSREENDHVVLVEVPPALQFLHSAAAVTAENTLHMQSFVGKIYGDVDKIVETCDTIDHLIVQRDAIKDRMSSTLEEIYSMTQEWDEKGYTYFVEDEATQHLQPGV